MLMCQMLEKVGSDYCYFCVDFKNFSLILKIWIMSDAIHHECGIALVRLLKPLHYYQEKYGSYLYGLNRLYILMETSCTIAVSDDDSSAGQISLLFPRYLASKSKYSFSVIISITGNATGAFPVE